MFRPGEDATATRRTRDSGRRRQSGRVSVVGSILSVVLAISIGFRLVNLVALGVYVLSVAVLLGPARAAVAWGGESEVGSEK